MTPKVPEISDLVIYQSLGSADGRYPPLPRAAIVTSTREAVPKGEGVGANYDEYTVDLFVMNPTGLFFNTMAHYDPDGKPGTWRYKKSQT